jgi:hypothetical protein
VFARAGSPQSPGGGGCTSRAAPAPTAAARGGALRVRIPGAKRLDVRLVATGGRTVARHRPARGTFTWRPQAGTGVYELRLGPQRVGVRRGAAGFDVIGPFSARLRCGALASATLDRPAFAGALRVHYRLRATARVVVTVRRGARTVARRATVPGPGAHTVHFGGLARGTYRVVVGARGGRATLAAVRP